MIGQRKKNSIQQIRGASGALEGYVLPASDKTPVVSLIYKQSSQVKRQFFFILIWLITY